MSKVRAKIKIKGKNYEVLVDVDKALQFKQGKSSINDVLASDIIFHNIKSGERAAESDLQSAFGTNDINEIAEKIIKSGEIEIPSEYKNKEREEKLKQIVDFLTKNAVNPVTGNPYTPSKIEESISQVGINIENKPIESQISRILEKLKEIIPIKVETKKIKINVPAIHTGKAYGILNEYKEKENWENNGDLKIIINLPVGLQMDFFDKLNSITHGTALTEEVKEK